MESNELTKQQQVVVQLICAALTGKNFGLIDVTDEVIEYANKLALKILAY